MTTMAFRDALLTYIGQEKDLAEAESDRRKALTRDEKIGEGLLLPDLAIVSSAGGPDNHEYGFRFGGDRVRLRVGEVVSIRPSAAAVGTAVKGTVLEVSFDTIVVGTGKKDLDISLLHDLETVDSPLYDGFLSALSDIGESDPGAFFLGLLCGACAPSDEPVFGPSTEALDLAGGYASVLDATQMEALLKTARQPSVHLVQGPPGTGKTRVLSSLAASLSLAGMETAVVAKTHQAVNNALNAVVRRSSGLTAVKIGQLTRSEGLDPAVLTFDTFGSYLAWRNSGKKRRLRTDVVGMTLNAAAINMCLRNTGFKPETVLVDEASQIPLAEAAMLGGSGAGSVIFFGDDRQMPPIFHPDLKRDPLSVSVFSRIRKLYPDRCSVLGVSYRMNDEICSLVSDRFYEPYGVRIVPSSGAAPRRMTLSRSSDDERIEDVFRDGASSVVSLNVSKNAYWRDSNPEEALFAAALCGHAMKAGVDPADIAVVTPFRRQVSLIRAALGKAGWKDGDCPLVDTVERLQGQDVRLVILSFSVTDPAYYASVREFLQDANRLNVMLSRAKEKVVIISGGLVRL